MERYLMSKDQNPFWTPGKFDKIESEGVDNYQIFFGENMYNPAPTEVPYNVRIKNFDFATIEKAITTALDPITPFRTLLILLYNNIIVSAKVKSLIKTRIDLNQYKKFYVGRSKNEINLEATNAINEKFLRDIITQSVLKEFYGYSGIYVNKDKSNNKIITVPKRRLLINPDLQVYTGIPSIPSGLKFRQGEMREYYCTFMQSPAIEGITKYGLGDFYNILKEYCLFYNNRQSSATLLQKFGIPTLHAQYKENPFGENNDLENIPTPDTISVQKEDPNFLITKEALQDYNGGGHIITNDAISIQPITNKLEAGSYQFFQQFLELNFRHITALVLGHENALTAVKNRGVGLDNQLITPEQIAIKMKETSDLVGIIDDLNDPETGLINKLPRLGIRIKSGERIMSEDLVTKDQTREKMANINELSTILGTLKNSGYELDTKTLNEIMLDYGIKLNKIVEPKEVTEKKQPVVK